LLYNTRRFDLLDVKPEYPSLTDENADIIISAIVKKLLFQTNGI